MTNYSFGAVASLTRNAVVTAIPTLAPVNTIVAPTHTPPTASGADSSASFAPSQHPTVIPFASTIEDSNHSTIHPSLIDPPLAIVLDVDPPAAGCPPVAPTNSTAVPPVAVPTANNPTAVPPPVATTNSTAVPPVASPSATGPPDAAPVPPVDDSNPIGLYPTPMCLDGAIEDLKAAPVTVGAALAADKSVCSQSYRLKKKKILCEFLEAIRAKHPKYARLLEPYANKPTNFPPGNIATLFVLLSGSEDKRKKVYMLNKILIDWIADKTNKRICTKNGRKKFPSPSTINSIICLFLTTTKERYSWDFTQKDFDFDGGYNAFFKHLVAMRQKNNVSISTFFCMSFSLVLILTICLPPPH